jgi:alpha-1,3-rhamnosyl/mannosyltransferase
MNLLWLVPGVVGGTEDAACGVLRAFDAAQPRDTSMHLYAQRSFLTAHPDLAAAFVTETRRIPWGSRVARVGIESTWLGSRARRDRLDVVHCFGGVVPVGIDVPTVLTLHDVQPLERDAEVTAAKSRWLSAMIPRSVARAAVVLVPSTFVRERLLELVDVDAGKVVVLPHGVEPRRRAKPLLDPAAVRRRFRLSGPFVLYPAITYPHKNHLMLIEAFARVRDAHPDVVLVLTGGAGSCEAQLAAAIERRGVGRAVRRLGRVSRSEVDGLYAEAAAVAYPSRYEGFGLPVLEALGAGTPVVAADAASMPEVLGGSGQLVDPDDPEAWATALGRVLDHDQTVQTMVERGLSRAQDSSWDKLVPVLVDIYRRTASGRTDGTR